MNKTKEDLPVKEADERAAVEGYGDLEAAKENGKLDQYFDWQAKKLALAGDAEGVVALADERAQVEGYGDLETATKNGKTDQYFKWQSQKNVEGNAEGTEKSGKGKDSFEEKTVSPDAKSTPKEIPSETTAVPEKQPGSEQKKAGISFAMMANYRNSSRN
jgi:hypothetical protein